MKLRMKNQIELSYANAKALVGAFEDGRNAFIYKTTEDGVIAVSIVSDEDHYTDEELARRKSPYLAPEAWAGVL